MRLICLLCLAAIPLSAAPRHFASGATRTRVLELYSSEGCSSCPPAEAWMAGLREAPGLWRDFVPVGFHVVYWDRLGWRDRFASQEFTARQYAYASVWHSESVYTPCFVRDGAEWRRGSSAPGPSAEPAGSLSSDYTDEGECRVHFATPGDFDVYVVLLGGGIVSAVAAGENAGRTLHHEFVALRLEKAQLRDGTATVRLPVTAMAGVTRHALAVWVTRPGELAPLQATGGWLD